MFDVKYRPKTYVEVLGQERIVTILKNIVKKGEGFQQSYVFSGSHGGGKTTLGRIFGKSLLCDNPQEGEACGVCKTCLMDVNPDFVEFDAATHSGKQDIQKILEEASISSMQGKRKLFLIDESHRLSKEALDALLKPMEDSDSQGNRKIVCVFCTTEVDKMRATIVSRCAPIFQLQKPSVNEIGNFLKGICQKEDILFDQEESLILLASLTKGHIRDALKALSLLGFVSEKNLREHFHLNNYERLLKIIKKLMVEGEKRITQEIESLASESSISLLYRQISEIFHEAYKIKLGDKKTASFFLSVQDLSFLVQESEKRLLERAMFFSSSLSFSNVYTLINDLQTLYQERVFKNQEKEGKIITADGFVGDKKMMQKNVTEKPTLEVSKFKELLDLSFSRIEGDSLHGSKRQK